MCLGRPWGRHGRPRSIFDRFWLGFEVRLGAPNRPKSTKNRCQDALKFCIGFQIDFGSIWGRFWNPLGHHFWVMLGIIWRIGDIAKNIENIMVFMNFQGSGGRKLASISFVFGYLFQDRFFDRLGVGFEIDFGGRLGSQMGSMLTGLGGLVWGRFWDGFWESLRPL